jgi:hypothetical protein
MHLLFTIQQSGEIRYGSFYFWTAKIGQAGPRLAIEPIFVGRVHVREESDVMFQAAG